MKRAGVKLLRAMIGGLGRLCSVFATPVNTRVLFVFATPNLGGAEMVHARIVRAVADAAPEVWFTEPQGARELLPRFQQHATIVNLGLRVRSRLCAYFQAGFQAGRIVRGRTGVVVGSFSHFFYDMLPWLVGVRCVDLLHNFGVGFEHYSLRHEAKLARRIVISSELASRLESLYAESGVDRASMQKLLVIPTAVDVPPQPPVKPAGDLNILFVGRNSPEKRVELAGRLASALKASGVAARMRMVGDLASSVSPEDRPNCEFIGRVNDDAAMAALYRQSHLLVLTSSREGFPLAVMEAMAHGVLPLVTRVGALASLPDQVCHKLDGDGDELVQAFAARIQQLAADRTALDADGKACHRYAAEHFDAHRFEAAWRKLLLETAP